MSFNTIQEVKDYINSKVQEHLSDKTVYVDYSNKMTRVLGRCRYNRRTNVFTLTFNSKFINKYYSNSNHIELTVAHEIAHALTQGHNHDYVWKQKCIELGGTGERLHKGVSLDEFKKNKIYVYQCPNCGKRFTLGTRFRSSRSCRCTGDVYSSSRSCRCTGDVYSSRSKLELIKVLTD